VSVNTFTEADAKSDNMIAALSSAELDLKEFVRHKDNEEESDDDEKDDEQRQPELTEEEAELKANFGRDKNGMFKNHKNFVMMRNKINDQESKH
jgi:hypothetical protein